MDHTESHSALTPAEEQAAGIEHEHPGWSVYWKVAVILTVITIGEIWVYYIPAFVASRLFLPTLLTMSAVKFAIVVLFYMHLRYDHKLFRVLFAGPLLLAFLTLFALLFLFGHLQLGHGG
jgi:cytochrome c oxidase subunit IV